MRMPSQFAWLDRLLGKESFLMDAIMRHAVVFAAQDTGFMVGIGYARGRD